VRFTAYKIRYHAVIFLPMVSRHIATYFGFVSGHAFRRADHDEQSGGFGLCCLLLAIQVAHPIRLADAFTRQTLYTEGFRASGGFNKNLGYESYR
jgi:hypothetical protein